MAAYKLSALAALVTLAIFAGDASAQLPAGQVITWKSWPNDLVNPFYWLPAGSTDWTPTGYPVDPTFRKMRDDTSLFCIGGADVYGDPNDNIGFAIWIEDGPTITGPIYAQNMPIGPAIPGGAYGFITFAFSTIRRPNERATDGRMLPLPAGTYGIATRMLSIMGKPAQYSRASPQLQCLEILLPPSQ